VEGELGAVMGHEAGPLPPYENSLPRGGASTDPEEAKVFRSRRPRRWLSVAIGNIHGAISEAARDAKKVQARLNLEHLERIREACGVPAGSPRRERNQKGICSGLLQARHRQDQRGHRDSAAF